MSSPREKKNLHSGLMPGPLVCYVRPALARASLARYIRRAWVADNELPVVDADGHAAAAVAVAMAHLRAIGGAGASDTVGGGDGEQREPRTCCCLFLLGNLPRCR